MIKIKVRIDIITNYTPTPVMLANKVENLGDLKTSL